MNTRARRAAAAAIPLAALFLSASLLLPTFRQATRAATTSPATAPLRALLVGGGPDKAHNQVAIESNIRFVRHVLPPATPTRTLFADGNPAAVNVQYLDSSGRDRYRASQVMGLDGPSRLTNFRDALHNLDAQRGGGPLLLYFTGHGSPDDNGGSDNNAYDMWDDDALTVKKLSGDLDTLSPNTPITLVMVQCFSGAFGNLLFQGGDPNGAWAGRNLCGFFASVPSREAAGCTDEVNEADYHDFTSYFFGALSGRDRMGRAVTGADYDGDGTVGMNEAFAYTLIHDVSIDTPVCTSDVFLRRYVPTPDATVFETPYTTLRGWGTPAQRAVLDGLSSQLAVKGQDRLKTAYAIFRKRTAVDEENDNAEEHTARWIRLVRCAKSVYLAHVLAGSPDAALKSRYAALLSAEAANPLRTNSP